VLRPYTVTYSGNGETDGSVPEDTHHYNAGDTVMVLGNTGNLVKTEDFFNGWNTQTDGNGINYAAGSGTFTMEDSDEILYAWWPFSGILYRDMVSVAGGTFTQQTDENGDGDVSDPYESFNHTISSFKIAKYELTYDLWYTVQDWAISNGYTLDNPGREGNDGTPGAAPTGAKYEPVTTIDWRDAIVWCNAYSEMSGYTPVYENGSGQVIKNSTYDNAAECDGAIPDWNNNGYRLPTEGEWQYAASSKGSTPYNFASGATADYNNAAETQKVAWYDANSESRTHNVGTTDNPSALTLRDMSGNVFEWCWDWHESYPGTGTDYQGPSSGSSRVFRGGSWNFGADYQWLGIRGNYLPGGANYFLGFRLASKQ
jgi:formylglycine-generating enzyme required for sulfatase activity